jgi:hypothetical protein
VGHAVKVTKHLGSREAHREPEVRPFGSDKFGDQYETALIDLINQKRALSVWW